MTAFNMREENDEGKFDTAGNYVWNEKEADVQEDAWLDGVTKAQMNSALRAQVSILTRSFK